MSLHHTSRCSTTASSTKYSSIMMMVLIGLIGILLLSSNIIFGDVNAIELLGPQGTNPCDLRKCSSDQIAVFNSMTKSCQCISSTPPTSFKESLASPTSIWKSIKSVYNAIHFGKQEKKKCGPVCRKYCRFGFSLNEEGCPICSCNSGPKQ